MTICSTKLLTSCARYARPRNPFCTLHQLAHCAANAHLSQPSISSIPCACAHSTGARHALVYTCPQCPQSQERQRSMNLEQKICALLQLSKSNMDDIEGMAGYVLLLLRAALSSVS